MSAAAKKAKIETAIVLVLAIGLGVIFVRGPLKGLGLFGSAGSGARGSTTGVQTVPVVQSVSGMLQKGWEQVDTQVRAVVGKPAPPPPPPASLVPAYTAFELRDPLKSLLPKPATASAAGPAGRAAAAPAQPPPPPKLRIEGLLWGGGKPQAIIDGRVYGVQDAVAGMTITEINRSGVTIEYLGQPVVYPTTSGSPR